MVGSFSTAPEAELAKSALTAGGIEAIILADSVGGMRPHVAWASGGFRLMVREEDAEDARTVLQPTQL